MIDSTQGRFVELAADIVSAFVSKNAVPMAGLPALISETYEALHSLSHPVSTETAPEKPQAPAVPIKKSISDDYIVCLEDGKKFKSMRRHLNTAYGMTPEQYRAKWGLPSTYPMTAPAYSAQRSSLAKSIGLGAARSRKAEATRASSAPEPAATKRRRRPAQKAA